MEETNAPVVNPDVETTANGQPATSDVPAAKQSKTVFADEKGLTEYAEGKVNRTVNSVIAPEFFAHIVKWSYASDPQYQSVDEVSKRPTLKGGGISDTVRLALARLTEYSGRLVIESTRTSAAAAQAMDIVKSSSRGIFIMARQQIKMFGVSEDQAKAMAVAALKASQAGIAPELVLTDEVLDELWTASADAVAA